MGKTDQLYLNDMLDAIGKIERFTKGMNREEFLNDELVQSAVIRQLEIVGEAANQVSSDLREEFDEVPWGEIIGTRNKLIHDYSGVDLVLVWNIVEKEIDGLKNSIKVIFDNKGYERIEKVDAPRSKLTWIPHS